MFCLNHLNRNNNTHIITFINYEVIKCTVKDWYNWFFFVVTPIWIHIISGHSQFQSKKKWHTKENNIAHEIVFESVFSIYMYACYIWLDAMYVLKHCKVYSNWWVFETKTICIQHVFCIVLKVNTYVYSKYLEVCAWHGRNTLKK